MATRALAEVDEGEEVRLLRVSEEVELNLGSLTLLDEGGFIPGVVARVGWRVRRRHHGGDGRGWESHPRLRGALRPAVRRGAVTQRLVADAVFAVDDEDRVPAPGAIEVDEGRITWVGDPWQEAAEPATEVLESEGSSCPAWSTATATHP